MKIEKFRVVGPTDLITMDYREERVNFNLDDNNVCVNITNG